MSLPVLTAICDALVPSLPAQTGDDPATAAFWQRTASDAGVPQALAQALREYLPSEQYRQLQWLFALLANPAGSFLLTGHWGGFHQLPLATRQKVLAKWAISPIPALRQAFLGIKRLSLALFYSLPQPDNSHPNHAALRYPTTHPAP
ncbi:MAG TPA: hypothetical protein PK299_15560, partial [Anaerolineales bacterium]|nr:hypothetical protein [Anaerolineales bacterium]